MALHRCQCLHLDRSTELHNMLASEEVGDEDTGTACTIFTIFV